MATNLAPELANLVSTAIAATRSPEAKQLSNGTVDVSSVLAGNAKKTSPKNGGGNADKGFDSNGTATAKKSATDEASEHAKEMSDRTYGEAQSSGNSALDKTLEFLGVKSNSGIKMSKQAADTSDKLKSEKEKLNLMEAQMNDAGSSYGNFEETAAARKAVEEQRKIVTDMERSFEAMKTADKNDYYSSLLDKEDFAKVSQKGNGIMGEQNKVRWAIENPADSSQPNPLSVTKSENLKYISDDERAVYNYLLGSGDTKGADEFLEHIQPQLNARAGQEKAGEIESSGFGRTLREIDLGAAAGVEGAMTGLAQNFSKEAKPTAASQFALQGIQENIANRHQGNETYNLESLAVNAANTIGNMTPSMLVGGVGGNVLMGLSSRGNTYKQLKDQGYTDEEAGQVATILGIAEGTTQYVLGGISKLGGTVTKGIVKKATENITSGVARTAVELGIDLAGENTEEWLQNKIEPAVRNYMLGEDNEIKAFDKDDLYTVILTTITTGLLEAPGTIINNSSSANVGKSVKLNDAAQSVISRGLSAADPETRALAEGMQSGAVTQSDINLGNLAKGLNAEGVDLAALAPNNTAENTNPQEVPTEVMTAAQTPAEQQTTPETVQPVAPQTPVDIMAEMATPTADNAPAVQTPVETANQTVNKNADAENATKAQIARRGGNADTFIGNRNMQNAADRKVNAFQFDNPELRPYYRKAADVLETDLGNSIMGESKPLHQYPKNDIIRRIMSVMTRNEAIKALEDIKSDTGLENNANAKRMEIFLDEMLIHGYDPLTKTVARMAADGDYANLRESISGGVGNADVARLNRAIEQEIEMSSIDGEDISREEAESRVMQRYEQTGYYSAQDEISQRNADGRGNTDISRPGWEEMSEAQRQKVSEAIAQNASLENGVTPLDIYGEYLDSNADPNDELWQYVTDDPAGLMNAITAALEPTVSPVDILAEKAGVPPKAAESVSEPVNVPTNEITPPIQQNTAQAANTELNTESNANQQTAPAEPINRPLFNTPMGMNGNSEVREGRFSSNTLNNVQEANNIPEADRMSFTYETKPERQSVMEAAARLGNDRANEVQKLMDAEAWSGVQTDMAAQVERELYESGDVKAHADWVKIMNDHAISGGQGVQAWAKYSRKTGQNALEEVINNVNANENLTEEQRTQILNKADEAAHKYDDVQNDILETQKAAKESGSKAEAPQSLIDFIKETSKVRNTGTFFEKNLDRLLNAQKGNLDYLNNLAYNQMIAMSNDYTVKRTISEKIKSLQILAQLTSIATFNRNIGGNVTFGVVDALFAQNGVGVALDYLVSKATGKRTVNLDASWLSSASRKGAIDGLQKSALEVALDVDMGGTNKYGQSSGRTFKMSGNAAERFFSRWEQLLNYSLSTSDRTSRGQLEAETTRGLNSLKNSGLTDAEIQAIAEQNADYRLFQNKGMAYTVSKGLHDTLNVFGIGGTFQQRAQGQGGFGVGDIVNTYPGVPANLGVKALEYSPANIVKGGIELTKVMIDAKKGKLDVTKQNQAVMDVARGVAGVPLVALFSAAFKAGIIKNWDDEDDYDVISQNAAEGKKGMQVNWDAMQRWLNGEDATWKDGDTLDSIGWLEPINAFMSIGSLIANEDDDATLETMAGDWAQGAIQGVLEIPVMSNIANARDNFKYSTAESFGGKLADAAVSYAGSSATGFVPSPVRGLATSLDDYQRDTKGNTTAETALNSLKATIPGLRETLPTKTDGYGNIRTNDGTKLDRVVNTMINPGNRTHLKQSDVSNEVERLREATGNANIYPDRKAPKTLNFGGDNKVKLDVDAQREYHEYAGNKVNELYSNLMKDPLWDKFTDEQKVSLLSDAQSTAEAMAKAEYAKKYNVDWEDPYEELINGVNKPGSLHDIPALGEKNLQPYLQYHSMYKLAEKSDDPAQLDTMLAAYNKLPSGIQNVLLKKQSGLGTKVKAYNYGIHTEDFNNYAQAKEEAQELFDKNTDSNGLCELYALGSANVSDKAKKAILENYKDLGWLSSATAKSYEILSNYGLDYQDVANFFYSADFTVTESNPQGKSGGTLGAYETAYVLSQMDNFDEDTKIAVYKELRNAFDSTYNKWSPKNYVIAINRVARYEKAYGSVYGRRGNDSRVGYIKGNSTPTDSADVLYNAAYGDNSQPSYSWLDALLGSLNGG